LATADFITAELIKIQSGEAASGDGAEIIADLDRFLIAVKENTGKAVPESTYNAPDHFYIAPNASEAKNYYRIKLYYRLGTEMANVHAYSVVFLLKDIAEEMNYHPAGIITDNNTAGEIMRHGFQVDIVTKTAKDTVITLIESGSGEKEIEIQDSSVEEFMHGFPDSGVPDLIINLDDDWESPEEDAMMVAGTYVIRKEAGKGKTLEGISAPAIPPQEIFQVPAEKMNRLAELINQLHSVTNDLCLPKHTGARRLV
jgi:two-component system chemotaxis sensor kinase CheA